MAKYIDGDKALKALLDQCTINGYGGLTPNDVKRVMSGIPKADVQPAILIRGMGIPNEPVDIILNPNGLVEVMDWASNTLRAEHWAETVIQGERLQQEVDDG